MALAFQHTASSTAAHEPIDFELGHEAAGSEARANLADFGQAIEYWNGTEMRQPVLREAAHLILQGADVQVVHAIDPTPDPWRRAIAGHVIDKMTAQVVALKDASDKGRVDLSDNPMYQRSLRPALTAWREKGVGTGLGIYPLYIARDAKTLGEGIDVGVFDEPLFEVDGRMVSAREKVAHNIKNSRKFDPSKTDPDVEAENAYQMYVEFINTEIDPRSRIILSGSEDAVGIRARADLAAEMTMRALQGTDGEEGSEHDKATPVNMASLGCGSAIPVARTIAKMNEEGYSLGELHLVDQDPMALATAYSILRGQGVDTKKIKLHNASVGMHGEPIDGIKPGSVHIVDAWGFLEYFRDRSAVAAARTAGELLRPGGTFAFGNMLAERGQAEYFREVVAWTPDVEKRTIEQGLAIISGSGYESPVAAIPTQNSVYVGYSGRKPLGAEPHPQAAA